MSFILNSIFITNQAAASSEKLLDTLGLTGLVSGATVNFYDTNKQWDSVFIGSKGDCKILCNGNLSLGAFEDDNPLLRLKDCEIAAVIWNETVGNFGFCLIKNGKIERKTMVIDGDIEHDYGQAIKEELEISDDELFEPDEMEEILEMEGRKGLERMIKSEKICRTTNNIVKRYLGAGPGQTHQNLT
ncbi:MAG: hypothetical protein J0L99_01195 [Chitinophagales bacterium]|nr:hypothetical protein [Chitinophagales bacterium]